MSEEISNVRRELFKVRQYLARLEHRVLKMESKLEAEYEEERIDKLKEELRNEYPGMEFTPRTLKLLKLVGTLPPAPSSEDKEALLEAMDEKYA
jgi:predicted RNase H-like nuclease (RuvC/YqgF family)